MTPHPTPVPVPVPTALVVVDVQRQYVEHDPPPDDVPGLVSAVRTLLASARQAGSLVVHVRDLGEVDPRFPWEAEGRELVLEPLPGEPLVGKHLDDAYDGTGLGELLAGHPAVVLAGLQSEMCIAATARGAIARGTRVVLPHDAHSTWDIPAGPAGPAIPADHVRRVAAWSLGDDADLPLTSAEVAFARAPDPMP